MVGDRPLAESGATRDPARKPRRAVRAIMAVAACCLTLLILAPAASATVTGSGRAGVSLPVWPVAIVGSLLIVAGALALGAAAFVWPRRRR